LPAVDPDFDPVNVPISCQWISYVIGALSILTEQATWDTEDPDDMLTAIEQSTNLIAIFTAAAQGDPCGSSLPPISCPYNFQVSDAGWTIYGGQGVYSPGTGFVSVGFGSGNEAAIALFHDIPAGTLISHVEFDYAATANGSGTNNSAHLWLDDDLVTDELLFADTHTVSWDGTPRTVSEIFISVNSGTSSDIIVIDRASFRGVGNDGCG